MKLKPYALGLALGCVLFTAIPHKPFFYLNLSASMPRGLYLVQDSAELRRGDVVIVPLGPAVEALAVERGYIPPGVPLIKPIVALAGDVVCIDETVRVNGAVLTTTVKRVDSAGRDLPHIEDCLALSDEEVFLLSTTHECSFDSRYFGPVDRNTLRGKVRQIWRW